VVDARGPEQSVHVDVTFHLLTGAKNKKIVFIVPARGQFSGIFKIFFKIFFATDFADYERREM